MRTPAEFLSAYEGATNSHDLPALLSMIADDAVYFFSDESVHVGKQAIERILRRNFDSIQDETYALDNVAWLAASDDVAACVYDYAWSGRVRGRQASGSGRGTTILRRAGDDWKVVHEHLSRGRFSV